MERRAFLLAVPAVAVVAATMPRAEPRKGIRNRIRVTLYGSCNVCGAPGKSLARDAYEVDPVDGCAAYDLDDLKVGCAAHPAESITYDRSGAVDAEAMEADRRLEAEARARWRV